VIDAGLEARLTWAAHISMHFSAQPTPSRICTADGESHREIQAIHRIDKASHSSGSPTKWRQLSPQRAGESAGRQQGWSPVWAARGWQSHARRGAHAIANAIENCRHMLEVIDERCQASGSM